MNISMAFFAKGAYPYESVFGIVINLARFNGLSPKSIYKLAQRRSLSTGWQGCMYQSNFYAGRLPASKSHHGSLHFPGSLRFSAFDPESELKFCTECVAIGYHSIFHCYPPVKNCFLHSSKLILICMKCKESLTAINTFEYPCPDCGFFIASLEKQVTQRIRSERIISIFSAGRKYHSWFFDVSRRANAGSTVFRLVDCTADYTVDPAVCSFVYGLGYPGFIDSSDALIVKPVIRFITWKADADVYSDEKWLTECDAWKKMILPKHSECIRFCEKMLGYWDGTFIAVKVCLLSVIYFFVRLRLSCLNFKYQPVGPLDDLGFEYVAHVERSLYGSTNIPAKLMRIYAIKLMFHVGLYLANGYTVKLRLNAFIGMFYDLAIRLVYREDDVSTFFAATPFNLRSCVNQNTARFDGNVALTLERKADGVFELFQSPHEGRVVFIDL